jgi:hypothetical protein
MNRLLKDLSERYNLTTRNLQAWGTIDSYWFQISVPPNVSQPLKITAAVQLPDEAAANTIDSALAKLTPEIPAISFARSGGVVTVSRKMPYPYGKLKAQDVEAMLLRITVAFRQAGAAPACYHCNERSTDSYAMVNGEAVKLCSQCAMEMEHSIVQKTDEFKEVPNNYLKGTLGAILGALVGSIAWVVIGLLGYIAAIGGIAISFCAAKGYTLLKGKITKPAVLIICLVSVVVMVLAEFVSYDIAIYNEAINAGYSAGIGEVSQLTFNLILYESEVTGEFVKNCLLGLLFLALGSYSIIKPLFATAKAPAGKFERL